jgi:PAS domain S-box-containing protein
MSPAAVRTGSHVVVSASLARVLAGDPLYQRAHALQETAAIAVAESRLLRTRSQRWSRRRRSIYGGSDGPPPDPKLGDGNAWLAVILAASDDAIIGNTPDGVITFWNRAAERMFGYPAAEVVGRHIAVYIPPERRHEEEALRARVWRGERVEHVETVRRARDGRDVAVSLSVLPVRDAQGTIIGVCKIARDISERHRAARALQESEDTARALIESAAEGIVVVDEAGRIIQVNGQIETMFGYAEPELLGQPMEILLPERLRARHVDHRAAYVAEPRVRAMGRGLDLAARRRDGSEFPVEISLSYVRTPRGLRAMAFVTDITERVMLERASRQAEKLAALGALSAGVAHELNNPLGIITSRIEVMLLEDDEQHQLPEPIRDDLSVLYRQTQRVSRLVHGLLSFARPTAAQRGPVNLNDVVGEILTLAEKQFEKTGLHIATALDGDLPMFVGDPSALQQVALNLVSNAHQAMNGRGNVRIVTRRTSERPDWIEMIVSDNGPGIPPDVITKIFDPFFTTKSGGTGLGLAISYRIVQEHGGTMEVKSVPGEGATFVLGFPVARAG